MPESRLDGNPFSGNPSKWAASPKPSKAPRWWDLEVEVVHADSGRGAGYTLCGDSLHGINGDCPMLPTDARITCVRCIQTIDVCKAISGKTIYRGAKDVKAQR